MAKKAFVDAVRALRSEQMSFDEIERTLGERVREAIRLVRAEEDAAGGKQPSAAVPKAAAPTVSDPKPYAAPRRSGCRTFAEGPALVS